MNLSQIDTRKLIYYCWERKLSPHAMAAELNITLDNGTVSESTYRQWVLQFNEGKFDAKYSDSSGRPSLYIDDTINQ